MTDRNLTANRSGFTLLEVVIASGLATLLLLLVWSLFSTLSKLHDRGASQATELQLVRSLMRQLRSDLHHAQAPLEFLSGGNAAHSGRTTWSIAVGDPITNGVSVSSGVSITSGEVIPSGDSEARGAGPGVGQLRGSSNWLQIVLRASEGSPMGAADSPSHAGTDVYMLVEYSWQPRGPGRLPGAGAEREEAERDPAQPGRAGQGLADGQFHETALSVGEPPLHSPGLTRRVTSWLKGSDSRAAAEWKGAPATVPLESEVRLAEDPDRSGAERAGSDDAVPEAAVWRFRYFDGVNWLPDWDSGRTGRFPAAIEVAFDLQPEGQREGHSARDSADNEHFEATELAIPQPAIPQPAIPQPAMTGPSGVGLAGNGLAGNGLAEPPIPDDYEPEYRFVIAVDTTAWRRRLDGGSGP